MLIVFPLGLLITSLIFDFIQMGTGEGMWSLVAFYMIGAGVIGGLVSAVFGLIDWLAIPSNTRAKKLGFWHGGGNVVVVGLFIVSWFLRRGVAGHGCPARVVVAERARIAGIRAQEND